MKKTYATPTIAETGSVITETRGAITGGDDPGVDKQLMPEGSIGFNL